MSAKLRLGILASTRGTSMGGLVSAIRSGELHAEIALIVSDKATAPVLERAAHLNLPHQHLSPAGLTREAFDDEVTEAFASARVNLILMIGYMRIVSNSFIQHWRGRLLNVHPSLLPAFAGGMNKDVHAAVLASGVDETGCTVHHVTEVVDGGPIVLQRRCLVLPGDTVDSLKDRVQALESEAFVEVVKHWNRQS